MATLVVIVVGAGLLGWQAFGPDLTHACPAPGLRPAGSDWLLVEQRIGSVSGPGATNGSMVSWHRPASAASAERDAAIFRWSTGEGPLDERTPGVAGGREVTTAPSDYPTPDALVARWREGLLGCTFYELYLGGADVTRDELLTLVAGLR